MLCSYFYFSLCFIIFMCLCLWLVVSRNFSYVLMPFLKLVLWLLCQHIYKNGMNYSVQSALTLISSCFSFYNFWCVTVLYLYICVICIELNCSILAVYSGTSYFFSIFFTLTSTADVTCSSYLMYVFSLVVRYCCIFYVFYAVSVIDLAAVVPA